MTVVPLPTVRNADALIADLKKVVAALESGEAYADIGVLVLKNSRDELVHVPSELGYAQSPSGLMGLLAYGSALIFSRTYP